MNNNMNRNKNKRNIFVQRKITWNRRVSEIENGSNNAENIGEN